MKTSNNFIIGIFALLLVVNFASAATIEFNPSSLSGSVDQGSSLNLTFNIENTHATSNLTGVSFSLDNLIYSTSFISSSNQNILNLQSEIINGTNSSEVIYSLFVPSDQPTGVYEGNITISGTAINSVSSKLLVSITVTAPTPSTDDIILDLCGSSYNDSIVTLKVDDSRLDNKDEWDWKPLDNIEVEMELRNIQEEDIDYEVVRLYFYQSGDEVSYKVVTDEDDLENDLSVDKGDRETLILNFQVDGQVQDDNYDVYAYVEDENGQCYAKKVDTVNIDKNSQQIVVKEVEADKSVSCGQTVDLTARIANIGKKDQDQVKVIIYNKDLGLNMFKELENVDEGDTANAFFTFTIPQNAKEQNYRIQVSTEYDYDDRDENYDEISDSDDDLSYTLSVLGGCIDLSRPTISANLKSSAVVGEEMVVEVSIKNNAATSTSYVVSVDGYSSWADSLNIEDTTLSASAGQSTSTEIKLTPTEQGQQTFNIKVVYNGEIIEQAVTVKVSNTQSAFSNVFSGGSLTSYLVTGILILLILIVIVFVIKAIASKD